MNTKEKHLSDVEDNILLIERLIDQIKKRIKDLKEDYAQEQSKYWKKDM